MASENQSRPHRPGSAFTRACARTHAQTPQWAEVTVPLICLCVAEMQPTITHTHTHCVMSEASRGRREGLARSSRRIISHSALKPWGSRGSCRGRGWRELATRQTTAQHRGLQPHGMAAWREKNVRVELTRKSHWLLAFRVIPRRTAEFFSGNSQKEILIPQNI